MATTINPLRYARRLEASGLPRAQAEAIAEGAAEELQGDLEPRLGRIEERLDRLETGLADLRAEMRVGFAETRAAISDTKSSLLMWMVPLLAGQILALLALVANSFLRQPPH